MDDILHILGLLQQRAQADLLALTNHKAQLLSRLSDLKNSVSDKEMAAQTAQDIHVLEAWRQSQMSRARALENDLILIDDDINQAKDYYKTILAKNLAAKDITAIMLEQQRQRQEEEDANTVLEISLLAK